MRGLKERGACVVLIPAQRECDKGKVVECEMRSRNVEEMFTSLSPRL